MAEWDSPYGLMRTAISSTSRLAIITPQTGTYPPVSSQLLSAFPGNACPTRLYQPLGSCSHSPRSHVTDLNRRGEVSPGGSAVRQLRLCRRVYFGVVKEWRLWKARSCSSWRPRTVLDTRAHRARSRWLTAARYFWRL